MGDSWNGIYIYIARKFLSSRHSVSLSYLFHFKKFFFSFPYKNRATTHDRVKLSHEKPSDPFGFAEAKTQKLGLCWEFLDLGFLGSLRRMRVWELCVSGAEENKSGFGLYGTVSSIGGFWLRNLWPWAGWDPRQMGRRFWVVEVGYGWFVTNGWSEEGDQPLFWGRRWLLVYAYGGYGGYGGFWLRNLWVFMWCNALLLVCHGSDRGGAGRGRQGREDRALRGIASGLEKFYYVFFFFLGFFS